MQSSSRAAAALQRGKSRHTDGAQSRCFFLELDDDLIALVLRRFAVRYTCIAGDATDGSAPSIERCDDAAACCFHLSLSCRRISVLVCLSTGRHQLGEAPHTLCRALGTFDGCLEVLCAVRDTEQALCAIMLSLPEDSLNNAFESTLIEQRLDVAKLLERCAEAEGVLRCLDDQRRRDMAHAARPDAQFALVLLAHRVSGRSWAMIVRQSEMFAAAASGQLRLLTGALKLQEDALSRARALVLAGVSVW
jgi:hypothetical protein